MRNAVLTIAIAISLFLCGCKSLPGSPQEPEYQQYGVHADFEPAGFYGVDRKTDEEIYKPFGDPSMKAAQCVSAEDEKKIIKFRADFRKWAIEHCK